MVLLEENEGPSLTGVGPLSFPLNIELLKRVKMDIQKYAKKEIALHQIETALRLFFEEGDLFSVITLAGAAEEVLGQILQEKSGSRPLMSILKILRPGGDRPRLEDEHEIIETEEYVHMDLRHEALFLLGRVIDDYHKLSGTVTAPMLRFNVEVREKNS